MSQDPINADNSQQTPPPPKKRRRIWLKILLGLFVLILLLIALLPTIASTGMVRSMIVGQVNDQINGKIEIQSWSLGWFSPISVSGIRVFDQEHQLVVDVPQVKLGLSILGAIRSNFAMGDDNVVEIASFVLRMDERGESNLQRLPKTKSGASVPQASIEPFKLPELSGKFTVKFHGTIESASPIPGQPNVVVHVDEGLATVNIPSINAPIQNNVKLVYRVGDGGSQSSIALNGDVNAIKNNLLDIANLAAGQKIDLTNVNLAALEPFLKSMGADTRLAGMMTGGIELKATGLSGLSTTGQIVVNGLIFGGGPLGADQFKTDKITIPVNITRTALPGGDSMIKFDNVGVQMSQGTINVAGQVPQSALLQLTKNLPPGADGSLTISANISDLKDIAGQLKNTLHLQEGVQINSGAIQQQLAIVLTKEKVTVSQNLKAEATGTRDNRQIVLHPITMNGSASIIPNPKSVPDVRDVKLAIQSAFATVNGGGDSLAKIDINGNFDLGKLQTEIAQFADMGTTQLQGSGTFNVNTSGDLTRTAEPIVIKATAGLQNIKIIGVAEKNIDQDRLTLRASGNLMREQNVLDKGTIYVDAGDPSSPLIEINADANINLADGSLAWFELKKCTITSLPRLQQQYGGLVPTLAEQKIAITSGALHAQAAGSFKENTLTLSKPAMLTISNVTINRENRPILSGESLNASAYGRVSLKDGIIATFDDLSLTTTSKMLMANKTGSGPLMLTMTPAAVKGSGAMTVAANLKPIAELVSRSAAADSDQPRLTNGQLNGTLTLAQTMKFDGQVTGLSISAGRTNPIQNEQITVALEATVPDDAKVPISAKGKIGSTFINTTLSDVQIVLGGAMLDMLQSASVDAQIPNARKLYVLANSLSPSTAPAVAGVEPLEVTGGSATLRAKLSRNTSSKTTTVEVTDAQISQLAIKRGQRQHAFEPITFKLSASVQGTDKLDSLNVKELSADARVATLSMPEPIVITNLQSAQPTYKGAIKAQGTIEQVTPILAVLQGASRMPYEGNYELNQKLSNNGPVTGLAGSIDINDFKMKSDNGREVLFAEPQIAIRNVLDVDPNQQKVAVKTLTIDMPQSQALAVSFTGGVNYWNERREIRPDTKLELTYDLQKLWPLLRPMLSPETQASLKDLKIAGKDKKTFALSGAFPSKPTFGESIRALSAEGGLSVDLLETSGLNIQKLQPQIAMKRGVITLTAKPAIANEGKLDLGGITLDLTKADPLLTIQKNKKLLEKVKLNPVLADVLGQMGAMILIGASDAQGLLTVNVIECNGVPLGALIQKQRNARAQFTIAVDDLQLSGPVPQVISAAANLGTDGLRGGIPASTIELRDGIAQIDLTVQIARQVQDRRSGRAVLRGMPLKFKGGMTLANLELRDFVVDISPDLLRGELRQIAPNGAVIPLKGKADKPQLDLEKFIRENAIRGILGGGGNGDNPLGDILNQLGGNRGGEQQPPPQTPPRQPRNQNQGR